MSPLAVPIRRLPHGAGLPLPAYAREGDAGADLVALPENFAFLKWEGSSTQLKVTLDGELVTQMRTLAADVGAR